MRLQLHALANNLANFMRTLALPEAIKHWSLTGLREKLVKIGAKVVRHGRYVIFQMAEVAVPRMLFAEILRMDRSISRAFLGKCLLANGDNLTALEQPKRIDVDREPGAPFWGLEHAQRGVDVS